MPSFELFAKQDKSYQESVLPKAIKKRLAVETGISQGWHYYLGDEGDMISIEKYGASAPGSKVLTEYGFTVENVCKRALSLLGK